MDQGCVCSDIDQLRLYDSLKFKTGPVFYIVYAVVLLMPAMGILGRYGVTFPPCFEKQSYSSLTDLLLIHNFLKSNLSPFSAKRILVVVS